MPIPPFRDDGWLPIGHHRADWEEVAARFGGPQGTRRESLTNTLLELRDSLRLLDVSGSLLLNGSYISAKVEPGDFDVLLIAQPDIQPMKDCNPNLAKLLDADEAEKRGYSLFYIPGDSPALEIVKSFWDLSKEQVPKGCIEVEL